MEHFQTLNRMFDKQIQRCTANKVITIIKQIQLLFKMQYCI